MNEQKMMKLVDEIGRTIDDLAATNDINERKIHSEILQNLTGSISALATPLAGMDDDEMWDELED